LLVAVPSESIVYSRLRLCVVRGNDGGDSGRCRSLYLGRLAAIGKAEGRHDLTDNRDTTCSQRN
jgi:hypothetical protein